MNTPTWEALSAQKTSPVMDGSSLISMYDMNTFFVRPWTEGCGSSIALLMNPEPRQVEMMVSHAWGGSVVQSYNAFKCSVLNHEFTMDTSIFFCTFCMYQPGDKAVGALSIREQIDKQPFARIIESKPQYGMVVLHTTTCEVYSRLWTVHEVDEGVFRGICMRGLCDFGKFTAEEISSSMMINTREAHCREEDRPMLVAKINDRGGFDHLDSVVRGFRAKMKQEFQQGCEVFQKLSSVPLMKRLHGSQHVYVSAMCKERDFMAGDVLIEQGDCHDAFYIILDGEANCMTCDKFLFKISSGHWIGELNILYGEPSTVKIQACRPMSTLMISKNDFQGMQLHKKLHLPEAPVPKPPSPKSASERAFFIKAVTQNEVLKNLLI